jgi:type II restriction enzyme
MSKRNFANWLAGFKSSISDYGYYVDFQKVYRNVDSIKVELNILNSLVGSQNIEADFTALLGKYPECLKCIPLLLAVREREIFAVDVDGEFRYDFATANQTPEQYRVFMRKTGLFELLEKHVISNLVDYATGVETGLDSNGRKNRGGHIMENLVEANLLEAGFIKDSTYFKEMKLADVERISGVDLSDLSNDGKTVKRFDFVVKTTNCVYGIECNFYSSSGSKLNETARSYKTLALEAKQINDFQFVWFTDGQGWKDARHNLEETFDVMDHIYNLNDIDGGIMGRILI